MLDFDIPKEKEYSARISRETLLKIKKGIRNYIIVAKRYRSPSYNATQLAKDIGVNTRYLSAALQLHFNCNFNELVNQLRVEEAKLMMLDEEFSMTMEDVALSSGFRNRQSFYNAFSKFVGIKPKEWMAQQQEQKRLEIERQRIRLQQEKTFGGLEFD